MLQVLVKAEQFILILLQQDLDLETGKFLEMKA